MARVSGFVPFFMMRIVVTSPDLCPQTESFVGTCADNLKVSSVNLHQRFNFEAKNV